MESECTPDRSGDQTPKKKSGNSVEEVYLHILQRLTVVRPRTFMDVKRSWITLKTSY